MNKQRSGGPPGSPKRDVAMQEGYVPVEKKGYTPAASTEKLPKAPQGGTGQSSASSSTDGARDKGT